MNPLAELRKKLSTKVENNQRPKELDCAAAITGNCVNRLRDWCRCCTSASCVAGTSSLELLFSCGCGLSKFGGNFLQPFSQRFAYVRENAGASGDRKSTRLNSSHVSESR